MIMANEYTLSHTAEAIDRKLTFEKINDGDAGVSVTNPYGEGYPVKFSVKTNGDIAICEIVLVLLALSKCNGEIIKVVIDKTHPHFELLYNLLSQKTYGVFTQYTFLSVSGHQFDCTYRCNANEITFNVIAPKNVDLSSTGKYISGVTLHFVI